MNAIVRQPISPTRSVLHLCTVDLRRFHWLVSGIVGIELVRAALVESSIHLTPPTATPGYSPSGVEVFLPLLDLAVILATAVGTALLAQADHPTDDRAFWRTRPIPPLAVAAAKLLVMMLLFVLVPGTINAGRLLSYGAPLGAVAASTLQIAVLAGVVCVPAWFVAVVTHTLPRFLGALFGVIVVGYSILGTVLMLLGGAVGPRMIRLGAVPLVFDWQSTEVHGWWGGAVSTVVGLGIVAAHYRVRRLTVTIVALLLLVAIPRLVPPASSNVPAPADLSARIAGHLSVVDGLSAMSYSSNGYEEPTTRVDGRLTAAPLPKDVSAAVKVDRITVSAGGRSIRADGVEQCCLGTGPMGVLVPTAITTPARPGSPTNNPALFTVRASAIDLLRGERLNLDADTTTTFSRHRLAGAIPLRPGASLRGDGYLVEVLAVEVAGSGFLHVVVRFARFPAIAGTGPRLDLFKAAPTLKAAWLIQAPWPIATYNAGTTVNNWSLGRTWVGRFSFTIDRRAPLPPDAVLAVVESSDIGTSHARLVQTNVPITVPPERPSWIH